MTNQPKPTVLIVGGGVFGTSTAYHLATRGYGSVTVLDRFDAPSKDSAAADLNKVVRADYPNPLYAQLAMEAMKEWKDPAHPIFSGLYRETGWIMGAHEKTLPWIQSAYDTAKRIGRKGVGFLTVPEIHKRWPALSGEFNDWTNLWSPAAGWVPSGQALLRMANAAREKGVRYLFGDAGFVKKLVYDDHTGACTGVVTADGTVHHADLVIVSNGAAAATILPDARNECVAQGSAICVIQLTEEEAKKYRATPIVEDFEQAIIFPPDENNMIKLCTCRALTNFNNKILPGASILHSLGDYPYDGCPKEIEDEIHSFIGEVIPELADRPFVSTKVCWDAVAGDLNFRVGPYPGTKNLFVATLGSNHGFKFLPVIGKYVADMIEGSLGQEWLDLWRWKNGKVPADHKDPHPYPLRDLSTLTGWKNKHVANSMVPWAWSRL
ncbi:FAD dependent oxidoreductase [Niveomyces insectorum RCEF 264]|uniref:FAD dependent oxidoreductase n=1 Tax=Niveomyces insectorum RCEF 264 TaxID=1081102 RepID=A0A167T800_9HYPO|nr:FAD dependent oxidoreductase [Niveomyces insectorum RCEF 264]